MQEQLTCHEVEGKVVECPSQDAHTDLVVEAFERNIGVVAVATLPSEDGDGLDGDVKANKCSGAPPNN